MYHTLMEYLNLETNILWIERLELTIAFEDMYCLFGLKCDSEIVTHSQYRESNTDPLPIKGARTYGIEVWRFDLGISVNIFCLMFCIKATRGSRHLGVGVCKAFFIELLICDNIWDKFYFHYHCSWKTFWSYKIIFEAVSFTNIYHYTGMEKVNKSIDDSWPIV